MREVVSHWVVAAMTRAALVASACSGSTSERAPDARRTFDAMPRDPTVLWVAGQYSTAVALQASTCTGITVQNMPTEVVHGSGATEVTLVHATIRHTGTIARDGTFSTTPRAIDVGGGERHTLTISGRFEVRGFDAIVNAEVTRDGSAACAYSVSWVGTKGGEPNVVPE